VVCFEEWRSMLVDYEAQYDLSCSWENDGPRMGKLLRKENLISDVIIISTAIRAHDTAKAAAKACGYKGEVMLNRPSVKMSPLQRK